MFATIREKATVLRQYLATSKKRTFTLVLTLLVVVFLPMIVIVAQNQQTIRQRAAEPTSLPYIPLATQTAVFGKAILLNGASCAELETPTTNLNFAPRDSINTFTINGWFKANNLNESYIVAREDLTRSPLSAKPSYTVGIKNGYLEFTVNTYSGSANNSLRSATIKSDSVLNTNKWYYFSATRSYNAIYLHVDGKTQGTSVALENISGSALDKALTVGCQRVTDSPTDRYLTGFFNGEIDDIRISDYGSSDDLPIGPHALEGFVTWHFDGNFTPASGIENELKPKRNIFFVDSTISTPSPTRTSSPTPPTPTPTMTMIEGTSNNRVFLTSTSYNGDLGGLYGADSKCQERASAAKLGGTWKAWLSDDKIDAKSRLIHYSNAYKLINGTVLANNWNDLTDGTLQNFINITELGTPFSREVWTGTKPDGNRSPVPVGESLLSGDNCSNWTSNSSSGTFASTGLSYTKNAGWTDIGGGQAGTERPCDIRLALYCFEQPTSQSPTPTSTPTPLPPTPTSTPTLIPKPDLCTPCSADMNKDGYVDGQDTSLLRICLNKPISGNCANADVNKDGKIDVADAACIGKNFGKTCTTQQPTPTPTSVVVACTACSANVNRPRDNVVNIQDIAIINGCFKKPASGTCINADVDKSGTIDQIDLNCVLKNYLKRC